MSTPKRHVNLRAQLAYLERLGVIHTYSPPMTSRPAYRITGGPGSALAFEGNLAATEAFVAGAHAALNWADTNSRTAP